MVSALSRSTYSRTRKVGHGSNEHDFVGDDMMIRRTSVSVVGRNDDRNDVAVSVMIGGGADAVSALISSTLRLKKEAKSSAE